MKNIDYVNKVVSKKLSLPESTVHKVNSYFWNEVRKEVFSHEETSLFITKIGTFTHSLKKVRTEIVWVIRRIKGLKNSRKYTPKVKEEIIENYKIYLRKLLKQRQILITYYQSVNELKRIRKNEKMVRNNKTSSESSE